MRLLSTGEVAELLGVTTQTVRHRAKSLGLVPVQLGASFGWTSQQVGAMRSPRPVGRAGHEGVWKSSRRKSHRKPRN
jgi:hypothetical protein